MWGWGGYYSNNKDAMHDEVVCTPVQLASGIDWTTVAGHEQAEPTPETEPEPEQPINRGRQLVILS